MKEKLDKVQAILEKNLMPIAERFSQWPTLSAVRSAFFVTLPLIFITSLGELYISFPIEGYKRFMADLLGATWQSWAIPFQNVTKMLISPIVSFVIGYLLAQNFNKKNNTLFANPILVGIVALACYYGILPISTQAPTTFWLGSTGLFVSIVVSIASSKLLLLLFSQRILRLNWHASSLGLAVTQSFNLFVPAIIVIIICTNINLILTHFLQFDLDVLVTSLLNTSFEEARSNIALGLLYIFILQLLWFFGFHGAYMMREVTDAFYAPAMHDNVISYFVDLPLPHIVTDGFLETFVFTGGAGAGLALAGALFFFGKTPANRKLALFCLVPTLFNMNELLLFGVPVILNPIMLIPFLITPMILAATSYLAMFLEFVPKTSMVIEWTTPVFLSGYLSTDSWAGLVLQLVNIIIGMCVYAPFILLSNSVKEKQFKKIFKVLIDRSINTAGDSHRYITYHDDAGALARSLLTEMDRDIHNNKGFYLMLQPQVCAKTSRIISVESLVRWKSSTYGEIPTPVTIALAEGSGLIKELGIWIFREACRIRKDWMEKGLHDTVISVNVSGLQLEEGFANELVNIMRMYDLPMHAVEIEVTESRMLSSAKDETQVLYNLHNAGFLLAIDDFGMGHSSLKYLRQFPVAVVKIDGAIIRDVLVNPTCADIVATIIKLCRSRNMRSIAEFVETKKHADFLRDMGCDIFQGYLYSKPLLAEECFDFIIKNNTTLDKEVGDINFHTPSVDADTLKIS